MRKADRNPRQARAAPAVRPATVAGEAAIADGSETPQAQLDGLKKTIQELRRKTTLMTAELYELDEIRASKEEAAMQLDDARSKIEASNNRRKEMARVIANRNAKIDALNRANEIRHEEMARVIANRNAKIDALNRANEIRHEEFEAREGKLQARHDKLEVQFRDASSRLVASHSRRKEMARIIAKREAIICDLNCRLQARYEEIATLKRHLQSSASWRLKNIIRRIKRVVSDLFSSRAKPGAAAPHDASTSDRVTDGMARSYTTGFTAGPGGNTRQ